MSEIISVDDIQISASMANDIIISAQGGTKNVLAPMRYKGFIWPNNPNACSYSCERTVVKFKYPETDGIDIDDMGLNGIVISGRGEFFGPNAYTYWKMLCDVFKEGGSGEFYHPIYGDITNAIMIRLASELEPIENYVSYSFEFWEVLTDIGVLPGGGMVMIPEFPWNDNSGTGAGGKTYGTLKRGDRNGWVAELQKLLKADGFTISIDGSYGPQTESTVRKYQQKHGLEVTGIAGPETLAHIGLEYYTDSKAKSLGSGTGGGTGGSGDDPQDPYDIFVVRIANMTLYDVAKMWHVNIDKLIAFNAGFILFKNNTALDKTTRLPIGTKVKLPKYAYRSKTYYTVPNATTNVIKICSICGITVNEFISLNGSFYPLDTYLTIGTRVRVY